MSYSSSLHKFPKFPGKNEQDRVEDQDKYNPLVVSCCSVLILLVGLVGVAAEVVLILFLDVVRAVEPAVLN